MAPDQQCAQRAEGHSSRTELALGPAPSGATAQSLACGTMAAPVLPPGELPGKSSGRRDSTPLGEEGSPLRLVSLGLLTWPVGLGQARTSSSVQGPKASPFPAPHPAFIG